MRSQLVLPTLLLGAVAVAQSPLSLPFTSNNGLSAPAAVFFDLNVTSPAGITITGLDVNTNSTAGLAGTVEVYTTPNTYVGSQQTPANWTLAASGGVLSAGLNLPSPVCLTNGGMFLAAGSHGIYVRHVGVAIRYTNSTGTVSASTAEVAFSGGQSATATTPFGSAPIANRIFNGNIHYNVGNVPGGPCPPFATVATFGTGCYGPNGDSWYENFAGLTSFDLAGAAGTETVLVATPIGAAGYAVSAGASAWFTPTGTQILSNAATPAAMTDDTMSGPQTLPFTFNFPGGSATVMHATVNGFVHLGPTTLTTGDFTPTAAELHNLQPRLFAMWGDWQAATNLPTNPASGVYFDVDPSGQTVYFTWLDVADRRGQVPAAGATTNNFQCAIHATGVVEYRYRNNTPAATGAGAVMVGFSKGNLNVSGGPTSVDTGSRDLSASLPFATNGPDRRPLALASNAPRLGQNWNLDTTAVDPLSPITVTFFGAVAVNPGIDLGVIGAPGCNAHITPVIASLTGAVVAGASTVTVAIPNNPSLGGATVVAQSVCLTLANSLGLLTSNGIDAMVGL